VRDLALPQSVPTGFAPSSWLIARPLGTFAMGLLALDIVCSLLGVRGHIPRFDDFRPVPAAPTRRGIIVRALATMLGVFAVLSLSVWAMVSLAVQLF
jgi:hypothetical protein